jgi:hypothetical protein
MLVYLKVSLSVVTFASEFGTSVTVMTAFLLDNTLSNAYIAACV